MKKLLKIAAILFGVGAVLLIGAAVAVKIFFPPEKVKALVLAQVEKHLHRQAEVGAVSVGLFKGIEIEQFKLSERPDFSNGTFVSSEKFRVSVRLWPLLAKKIIINEIALEKPAVRIIRYADGDTFNFSDITASSATAAPAGGTAQSSSPAPETFLISSARISDGSLDFVDQSPEKKSLSIQALNVQVGNLGVVTPMKLVASLKMGAADIALDGTLTNVLSENRQFDLKTKFSNVPAALVDMRGAFSGDLTAQGKLDQMNLVGDVSWGSMKLTLTGEVSENPKDVRHFDFQFKSNEFPPMEVMANASTTTLPAELKVAGPITLNGDAQGTGGAVKFDVEINAAKLDLVYSDQFVKPAGTPLTLQFKGARSEAGLIRIDSHKVDLNGAVFGGNGFYNAASVKNPYRFTLKSDSFSVGNVANLSPSAKPYSPAGTASADFVLLGTPKETEISGKVGLKNVSAVYEGNQLAELVGEVALAGDVITVPKLTGKLNGAPLKLDAKIINGDAKRKINANIDVAELDLEKLLPKEKKTWAPSLFVAVAEAAEAASLPMDLVGTLKAGKLKYTYLNAGNLNINWNLVNFTTALDKTNGTLNLKLGDGKLSNLKSLMEGSRFAKIVLVPISVMQKIQNKVPNVKLPNLDNLTFNSLVGDYALNSGAVAVKSFNMDGTDLDANMNGSVGLVGAQALDLKAILKFAPGALGGTLGDIFNDDQGRPTLNLSIAGTLSDPKTGLDKKATGKQAVGAVKDILKNPEKMKDLQDVFKGIFK